MEGADEFIELWWHTKKSVNLYNLYSVGVDVVGLSMLFRARR